MSDEVSQFLESVERLRGQQIEEDEVRARELEEYLAAKRERQARRQERVRSISPQKSSPANTPSPRSSYQSSTRPSITGDAPKLDSPAASPRKPRQQSADPDLPHDAMSFSSPTKENVSPARAGLDPESDPDPKRISAATSPGRSPTLSWQQRRPASRSGSRPLSMVAAQNATQRSFVATHDQPASPAEATPSRDQIAQSLGSKDPTWFRQTPERGLGSAAYRRSQVEDQDRSDAASADAQLPGLSAAVSGARSPSITSPSTAQGKLASPFPLSTPRDGPISEDAEPAPGLSRSPTGRLSPSRSTSPTKGMGGFVQSAMMKRTDSAKRWSVQSPPGLTRADSVTSVRSGYGRSRPLSLARAGDARSPDSSRPTSQHGERDPPGDDSTPRASRAASPSDPKPDAAEEIKSGPPSPSKRWSPTKSSWLDSALNKPETPKTQPKPHAPAQPAWMADLSKNKAERAGNPASEHARSGSVSHRHQVSIGGLMRSSPMGAGVKPNTTDLGGIYSPPARGNRPSSTIMPKPMVPTPAADSGVASGTGENRSPEAKKVLEISQEPKDEDPPAPAPAAPEPAEPEPAVTQAASPERAPVVSPSSTQPKTKPATPPKKDFRANLKQRTADSSPAKSEEPEFKNALGNLRRARTQNYVAPDELKDNILRGKAGLNVTGGPQKTERKDEFKDAILKKRGEFSKAQADGRGVTRAPTISSNDPVPEGLARRAQLGRQAGPAKGSDSTSDVPPPATLNKRGSPKPVPAPKRVSSQGDSSPVSPSTGSSTKSPPPPADKPTALGTAVRSPLGHPKEASPPSSLQQGRPGGGKLGGLFNSGLADMIARGPPPMALDGGRSPAASSSAEPPGGNDSGAPPAPGPPLTHITKGRARGPKRKAPSTAVASQASSASPAPAPRISEQPTTSPGQGMPSPSRKDSGTAEAPEAVEPLGEGPSTPAPLSIQRQAASMAASRNKPTPPDVTSRSSAGDGNPISARPLPLRRQPTSPERQLVDPPSPVKAHKTGGDTSQPGSPKKLDVKRMSRFLDDSAGNSAGPAKEPIRLPHQRTGSRSPVKAAPVQPSPPTEAEDGRDPVSDGATSRFTSGGAAKPSSPAPAPKPSLDFSKRAPAPNTPELQSTSGARPLPVTPVSGIDPSAPADSPARSPSKQTREVSTLLTDFFGPGRPRRDYKVDPAALLAAHPGANGKIETLSANRVQITGDGKMVPLPAHSECMMFEQEMYLCTHAFRADGGKKMLHVYFWVGDGVAPSAAEDAQLFAQREARAQRGELIMIQQGKETAGFLQALGGRVVTRRGSSHKHDSLAPVMLCGRGHLGQVVFDEVEFSAGSLCAGFAYLVAQSGKCYLWKGKGCNVDELSWARLIGMDMTLTGDLDEYEEGREPDSFWGLFESGTRPHSADHWRLKPNYAKYSSRLFCSDADSRQQIFEISPFSQADLSPSSIYVLDAFFEMYVVVGSQAQPQFASFRNALNFAQEYAILAASMEDRPFVPVSTVVLEGVPRDLKRVFRKWSDDRSPTVTREKTAPENPVGLGILRRGRSLRVVPLTHALQAIRE